MMPPIRKLFAHTRAAHRNALKGAEEIVTAITDHDEEYASATIKSLEDAAEKMELAARTLREQIAVYRHMTSEFEKR